MCTMYCSTLCCTLTRNILMYVFSKPWLIGHKNGILEKNGTSSPQSIFTFPHFCPKIEVVQECMIKPPFIVRYRKVYMYMCSLHHYFINHPAPNKHMHVHLYIAMHAGDQDLPTAINFQKKHNTCKYRTIYS